MARTGPSAADAVLLDRLRLRGLRVSHAQLERWRHAGVLPTNTRTYLGRGKGSRSECVDTTIEIAEAMALVSRRGRSVYEAILRIFTVDPRHSDLLVVPGLAVPEPAIRGALTWFIELGGQTLDLRIARAMRRVDASIEDPADTVSRLAAAYYRRARSKPPPLAEYRPSIWDVADQDDIDDLTALQVAYFLGSEEVGSARLAEVAAGIFRRSASISEDKRKHVGDIALSTFTRLELDGRQLTIPGAPASEEINRRIETTSIDRIRAVREKLAFVAEIGSIIVRTGRVTATEPMTQSMLHAITESFESNMLLHAATPIAATLESDAWHRMAALLTMILSDADEVFSGSLDKLASAVAPGRFDSIQSTNS